MPSGAGSTKVVKRLAGTLALAGLLLLAAPALAGAGTKRVPDDFFGVNFDRIAMINPARVDTHLREIAAAGVTQLRLPVPWGRIEPEPPRDGQHTYRFDRTDWMIEAAARRGLQVQAMLAYAPGWAERGDVTNVQCGSAASGATRAFSHYASAARALARRYGRNGSFWAERPGTPYRPVVRYEIWNAPNTRGTWCPSPDPEGYGVMFGHAAQAVTAVDPEAILVVGGLGHNPAGTSSNYVSVQDFLSRMKFHWPGVLRLVDEVGVHVYPSPLRQFWTNLFWHFRGWLRAAGVPDSVPMNVNEIGWPRNRPLTEPERAEAYASVTDQLARTNCNISSVLPHTWISEEQDPDDREHFFGIASPSDGRLYASGQAYSNAVKLHRGMLAAEAPRETLLLCGGMPLPDQDGDGVPDQDDPAPLDPSVPGDGGSEGGAGEDGGDRGDRGDRDGSRPDRFRIVGVRRNKRRGIARLQVEVPGPGRVALKRTRRVKRAVKRPRAARTLRLKVRPRGKARRKLRRTGRERRRMRVRVRAKVRYKPSGGKRQKRARKLRLVRRR